MGDTAINDAQRRFKAAFKKNGWLGKTPLLLGVSGGSDSMALLYLSVWLYGSSNVAVAHLDHCVRNTSSRDRIFVENVCRELGVKFLADKKNMLTLSSRGESPEETGRRLRYELYEKASRVFDCPLIALGHTRTDLAESVILNMSRGCGLWGLAGIPPQRGRYIRPLIAFEREELRDYLRARGLSWVEDETNDEDIYTRNRVRHHVLPLLEETVNPKAASHLAGLAEEAWLWRKELDRICYETLTSCAVPFFEWPSFSISRLRKISDLARSSLFYFIARKIGLRPISRERLEALSRLVASSGRWVFQWGSETDVFAEDGSVTFAVAGEKKLESLRLEPEIPARWGGWNVLLTSEPSSSFREDFGFYCPDGSAEGLILRNDTKAGSKKDLVFPVIEQVNNFSAKRVNGKWDFGEYSVKYTGAFHVVLTPISGSWRGIIWN